MSRTACLTTLQRFPEAFPLVARECYALSLTDILMLVSTVALAILKSSFATPLAVVFCVSLTTRLIIKYANICSPPCIKQFKEQVLAKVNQHYLLRGAVFIPLLLCPFLPKIAFVVAIVAGIYRGFTTLADQEKYKKRVQTVEYNGSNAKLEQQF